MTHPWKYQKAIWDKYAELINQDINKFEDYLNKIINLHSIDINKLTFKFTKIILDAADQSIPKSTGKKQEYHTPWWNSHCEKAMKNYKKAFNR